MPIAPVLHTDAQGEATARAQVLIGALWYARCGLGEPFPVNSLPSWCPQHHLQLNGKQGAPPHKRCANLRCPRNGKRTSRVPAISRKKRRAPRGLSIRHCSLGNGKADRPLRQPGYRPGRWISANRSTILLRGPILTLRCSLYPCTAALLRSPRTARYGS